MPEIKYSKDGDMICATYPGFKNLQESIAGFGKTEEEAKKDLLKNSKKGFCTIFNKKNNIALDTLKTVGDFTENHGIAYGIIGGLLGVIKPVDRKELEMELLNYVNNKLDPKKKAVEIEAFKVMFEEFNKKYRILIG